MTASNKPRYKRLTKYDIKALENGVARYSAYAKLPKKILVDAASEDYPNLEAEACGLCVKYMLPRSIGEEECVGCPVFVCTGARYCRNTPYQPHPLDDTNPSLPYMLAHSYDPASINAFKKRCREEAAFLQSLLDNNPGKPKA